MESSAQSLVYPNTGNAVQLYSPAIGIEPSADPEYGQGMDTLIALRRNLTALMDAARDGLISGPTGVLQLEAATDVGKSTLYRILAPREKTPPQIDTLERIGAAYGLQAWQLLVPRLDPLDPPAMIGARRMNVLRSMFSADMPPDQPAPPAPPPPTKRPGRPRR